MDMFAEKPTYEQLETRVEELEALVAKLTRKPASVRQVRFADFWRVYPNKKGKQEAEKAWQAKKLDGICDQLIDHVLLMNAQDDGWFRGYAPMGSTYLNQERWTDVPQAAPVASKPAPSKHMQALMQMGGMNGLDRGRDQNGAYAATVHRHALDPSPGYVGGNANGLGRGGQAQPGMGSGAGWPALPRRIPDVDG